jgi:hypothetical protein
MASDLLERCRIYLAKSYSEKLNYELASSLEALNSGRQPVWRCVRSDDLTTEADAKAENAAGVVLDPEIGVLLYLLVFTETTDLRKQVLRALNLRSQLSAERNYKGKASMDDDLRGAWRVVIHWLVDSEKLKKDWIEQIIEVRRETAFSEEVSFDAIFSCNGDFDAQMEQHGFPRLLITTREVFKKEHASETDQWMSANKLVEGALKNFSSGFKKQEQQEAATEVMQAIEEYSSRASSTTTKLPLKPVTFRSFRVQNFRNLRDISVDFGFQPVSAGIIHGPNGTGKSGFCEAISLALFQSSPRYKTFASREKEKDISASDRRRHYSEAYLAPISGNNELPRVSMDGQEINLNLLPADKVEETDLAMCGTILTQDASQEFARMPSDELGARVLRGYSDLAEHVEMLTESRFTQANTIRQDFLRRLGLPASITKLDTALERITRNQIDKLLPAFPQTIVLWLERISKFAIGDQAVGLCLQWRTWGGDGSRSELSVEIARSSQRESIQRHLRRYLEQYNALSARTTEFLKGIQSPIEAIRSDLDSAPDRIGIWGEWLDKRAQAPVARPSSEAERIVKQLIPLQNQQQQILKRGQAIKSHFDHLTQVQAFVRQTWPKNRENECPSCGANHPDQGGVLKVIEALSVKAANEREDLLAEFAKLKIEIDNLQKQLAVFGQTECPLNDEERSRLAEIFRWLLPEGKAFPEWIGVKSQREELTACIRILRQIPSQPAVIGVESEAERVAEVLLAEFRNAENTFEAPNNWKPVKEKLTATLATIVNDHLPSTLVRLWCELAMNLTSAPWLLPERPRINVGTRRGEQKATVCIKDRLARYILNQSEIHILGLSWFFTRYLTHGRFTHACLVMDDPAQELDQTSFRDLCRMWETWVRLHSIYGRPLKLIILLNQESRALDAARATNGVLTVFGWTKEQDESLRAINVTGDGFYAPQPAKLFAAL